MNKDDFTKGYVCALAEFVSGHGTHTAIREAIYGMHLTFEEMRKCGCDQYDIQILKEEVKFVFPDSNNGD